MGVPVKYRKSFEPAIASYNYTDIAEGTGISIFYGSKNQSSYILNSNTFCTDDANASADGVTTQGALPAADAKILDLDFDLTAFNTTVNLRGVATCSAGLGSYSTQRRYGHLVWRIKKWDGTTETELATVTSSTMNNGGGSTASTRKLMSLTIPITQFKKGEILRCTIEVWGYYTAGAGGTISLAHDPKNRAEAQAITTITSGMDTRLIFYIPFNLDL